MLCCENLDVFFFPFKLLSNANLRLADTASESSKQHLILLNEPIAFLYMNIIVALPK